MEQAMTFGQYAKHRQCSRPRVSQLVASGRLNEALVRDGSQTLIRPDVADTLWPRRPGSGHDGAAGPPLAVIAGGRAGVAAGNGHAVPGVVSRAEADRRRAVALAEKEELEIRLRLGEVVKVAEVAALAERAARGAAEILDAAASRLAPMLAGITDAGQARELIDVELAAVRHTLADWGEAGFQGKAGR